MYRTPPDARYGDTSMSRQVKNGPPGHGPPVHRYDNPAYAEHQSFRGFDPGPEVPDGDTRPRRKSQTRTKLIIAFVILAVIVIAAVAVVVVVVIKPGQQKEEEKEDEDVLERLDLKMTISNWDYTRDLADSSTTAYQDKASELTSELDSTYNSSSLSSEYQGSLVVSFSAGSVKAQVALIFKGKQSKTATSSAVLKVLQANPVTEAGQDVVKLRNVWVLIDSYEVISHVVIKTNPLTTTTSTVTPTTATTTVTETTTPTTVSTTPSTVSTSESQPVVFDCPSEVQGQPGDSVTISCTMTGGQIRSLEVRGVDTVLFDVDELKSYSQGGITLLVNARRVTLTVSSVECSHEQNYTFTANSEYNAVTHLDVIVTIPASNPVISTADKLLLQRDVTFSCLGMLGHPMGSRVTYIEKKMLQDQGFSIMSDDVVISNDMVICTYRQRKTVTIEMTETWNGAKLRCSTVDDDGLHLVSDVIEIALFPVIDCPNKQVSDIDETGTISCDVSVMSVTSLAVSLKDGTSVFLSSSQNVRRLGKMELGMSATNFYLTFTPVSCEDENTYVFRLNEQHEFSVELSVQRQISVAATLTIEPIDLSVGDDVTVTCSGGLGYPLGSSTLEIEILYTGESSFTQISSGVTSTKETTDCRITQTSIVTLTADDSLRGARVRCMTSNGIDVDLPCAEQTIILTGDPVITCPEETLGSETGTLTISCTVSGQPITSVSIVTEDNVSVFSTGEPGTRTDLHRTLTVTESSIELVFSPLYCYDEDVYEVTVNGDFMVRTAVTIPLAVTDPVLVVPPDINLNGVLPVQCSAQVKRPTSPTFIFIQQRSPGDSEFSPLTDGVTVSTEAENCRTEQTSSLVTVAEEAWRGQQVRCLLTNYEGEDRTTEPITIQLAEPQIAFIEASHTVRLGESLTLTCRVEAASGLDSIAILRPSGQSVAEISSVDGTGIHDNIAGVTGSSDGLSDQGGSLTLTFAAVGCDDTGEYFCLKNNDRENLASVAKTDVFVLASPEQPVLLVPDAAILYSYASINCTGLLGRDRTGAAAGGLQFEIKLNSQTDFITYIDGEEIESVMEDCVHRKTIMKTVLLNSDWNEAEMRCVSIATDGGARLESPVQELTTQGPGLTCNSKPTALLGSNRTVSCSLELVEVLSSFTLKYPGGSFTKTLGTSIPGTYVIHERLAVQLVKDDRIRFFIMVLNTTCDDHGKYRVIVNDDTSQAFKMSVQSALSVPTITAPSEFVLNSQVEFTCAGAMGWDGDDSARAELAIELKAADSGDFLPQTGTATTENQADLCQTSATLTLSMVVDESKNASEIRCVAIETEDGTRHAGDPITIITREPYVSFKERERTGFIAHSTFIECLVNDVSGITKVTLSRRTDSLTTGPEETVSQLTAAGASDNIEDIRINTATSELQDSGAYLNVEFFSLKCGDRGVYTCTVTMETGATLTANSTLSVLRKPGIPSFSVPILLISGREAQFSCSAEAGDPEGSLVVQSNKDADDFYDVTINPESYTTETLDCSNPASMTFKMTLTTSWTGTQLRCAAVSSEDFDPPEIQTSTAKTLHVLSDEICYGVTGDVEHPYDCHQKVTCNNRILVARSCSGNGCTGNCCFDQPTGSCVPCATIGGCFTDESTGSGPYLRCDDVNTSIGTTATINCDLQSTSVTRVDVTKDGSEVFSNAVAGERSSGDVTLNVGSTSVSLTFAPVKCSDDATYKFTANGQYTDRAALTVQTPSTTASLLMPSEVSEGQAFQIQCQGNLGKPLGSKVIRIERKLAGEQDYVALSNERQTNEIRDCSIHRNVTLDYLGNKTWHGASFRCVTSDDSNLRLVSSVVQLAVTESEISFTESSYTSATGVPLDIACKAETTDMTTLQMFRYNEAAGTPELVATLSQSGLQAPIDGITASSTGFSSAGSTLTVTIASVTCTDQTAYMCQLNGGQQKMALTQVSVDGCDSQ